VVQPQGAVGQVSARTPRCVSERAETATKPMGRMGGAKAGSLRYRRGGGRRDP
jgi:hypothetical protein